MENRKIIGYAVIGFILVLIVVTTVMQCKYTPPVQPNEETTEETPPEKTIPEESAPVIQYEVEVLPSTGGSFSLE